MGSRRFVRRLPALCAAVTICSVPAAHAVQFHNLFLFGDSFTDTGAYVPLTNGSTAGGYLAQQLGVDLVTSKNPAPGTNGVNFAESGARIAQGPNAPATQPRSLTQQVDVFGNYVRSGALTFDSTSTMFFLLGGLNDHSSPTGPIAEATVQQVATLYDLGARYFQIALLPELIPAFSDSARNLNPMFRQIVPELQNLYPEATIRLSQWGSYYDDVMRDPAAYGITNTTDQCFNLSTGMREPACTDPDKYFYYYVVHPSDKVHAIVGQRLYAEVAAIPEPASIALFITGMASLMVAVRRQRRLQLTQEPTASEA